MREKVSIENLLGGKCPSEPNPGENFLDSLNLPTFLFQ